MKKIIVIASLFVSINNVLGQGFLIETPEMQVFYEGIPIELKAWATGDYKDVKMSIPSPYTAAQGMAGKEVLVSLTGIDKKGDSVVLGTKRFLVKKAPKPELTWGGIVDGGRANLSSSNLSCQFGNNVPFNPSKGQFTILNYEITISGVKGSLAGAGSAISPSHLNILKSHKGEGIITISVNYSGSGKGTVSSSFKL